MTQQPSGSYAALTLLLGVMSALLTVGGLFAIIGTSWVVGLIMPGAGPAAVAWMLVIFKALGALALFMAYVVYHAARDPVRYRAVIDAMAGVLIMLAALDVYASLALGFGAYYPAWAIWARAGVRLALAIVLLVLRPPHS